MAFAIYLHRDNFHAGPPLTIDKSIQDPSVHFTFVDFVPSVTKRSTTVIPQYEVEYHTFSVLLETANDWLERNGAQWSVVNCETVLLLYKYNDTTNAYEIRPHDCCFYIYGSEKNNVLKALRLWICRRSNEEPQVLKHLDITPNRKSDDDCRFEDLDEILERFNAQLTTQGLDGRIITIETVTYEASNDWKIDSQISLSSLSSKNIQILRVFYVEDEEQRTRQEIGIEDFAPKLLNKATFFKRPNFESFDKVIVRASGWLSKNRNDEDVQESSRVQFINAQSIDIKMKGSGAVNTRLMAYTEHGDYMRIFRIAYLKGGETRSEREENNDGGSLRSSGAILSTRLFLPFAITDSTLDIQQRLSDWFAHYLERYQEKNGQELFPRILSAETVEVFAKDFRSDSSRDMEKAANNDTFLANRFGNKNAYLFFSLRIFFDSSGFGSTPFVDIDCSREASQQ